MTRAPLAIWGAAGHARAVTTVARLDDRWQIVGYIDDVDAGRMGEPFCGASVIGGREALDELQRHGVRHLFLAFGANAARLALSDELQRGGFEFPSLVHPSALIADDARMEPGVFIGPGVIINANACIGKQSIVNSGAIVEHDVRLGCAVHVGPGACVAGSVRVDDCAWIGAGAVVRDKLSIGAHAMVGMGAVVTRSVPPHCVVVGCPAKPMRATVA
ncbi:MAG TPA: acetyltransferase [Burkholderiaceae bacterium]|nr:acetyltransferase [Burkholderiaceae bacterium]